jgi:hypothetical protein
MDCDSSCNSESVAKDVNTGIRREQIDIQNITIPGIESYQFDSNGTSTMGFSLRNEAVHTNVAPNVAKSSNNTVKTASAPLPVVLPTKFASTKFTSLEVKALLGILDDIVPCSRVEWMEVATLYNHQFRSKPPRSFDNLRRKFNLMSNCKKPTGDPTIPPEILKAKEIRMKIIATSEAGVLGMETCQVEAADFEAFYERENNTSGEVDGEENVTDEQQSSPNMTDARDNPVPSLATVRKLNPKVVTSMAAKKNNNSSEMTEFLQAWILNDVQSRKDEDRRERIRREDEERKDRIRKEELDQQRLAEKIVMMEQRKIEEQRLEQIQKAEERREKHYVEAMTQQQNNMQMMMMMLFNNGERKIVKKKGNTKKNKLNESGGNIDKL